MASFFWDDNCFCWIIWRCARLGRVDGAFHFQLWQKHGYAMEYFLELQWIPPLLVHQGQKDAYHWSKIAGCSIRLERTSGLKSLESVMEGLTWFVDFCWYHRFQWSWIHGSWSKRLEQASVIGLAWYQYSSVLDLLWRRHQPFLCHKQRLYLYSDALLQCNGWAWSQARTHST